MDDRAQNAKEEVQEGQSCTTANGDKGFGVRLANGQVKCFAGASEQEAKAAYASSVGQAPLAAESQASIDRTNAGGQQL